MQRTWFWHWWSEPLYFAERPFLLGSLWCPAWAWHEAQIDGLQGKFEDPFPFGRGIDQLHFTDEETEVTQLVKS